MPSPPLRHPRPSDCFAVTGFVLIALSFFLPWLRTGDVLRHSYAVLAAADRYLGNEPLVRMATRIWPALLPVVAVLALLLVSTGGRARAVVGALTIVWSVITATGTVLFLVLAGKPLDQFLAVDPRGPGVLLAGAFLLTLSSVMAVGFGRRGW